MDYNNSPLRPFFTILDRFLKFFGFSVLKYPSSGFKFSFGGLICFFLSFSYSILQFSMVFFVVPHTDKAVDDAVKRANKIVGFALTVTLISTVISRIISLLTNFALSKRIIDVMQMVEELDFMVR